MPAHTSAAFRAPRFLYAYDPNPPPFGTINLVRLGRLSRWGRPSLNWLLIFVPLSWVAQLAGAHLLVFATAGLAIVPLAGLIGRATDQLAIDLGPRLGGLLNATFGNVTELIVAILLVLAGEVEVLKASLVGSIIGNALLVLGISFLAGGAGRVEQSFNARAAGVHSTSLLLAVAGLATPVLLAGSASHLAFAHREAVSIGVAATLIIIYGAALVFTQVTHAHLFRTPQIAERAAWPRPLSIALLLTSSVMVGIESELFVSSLRPAISRVGISPIFAGLVLIPIIGNAAEHASAVYFAVRDKLDVSLEIAIGSSTQVALLIAPLLVFISLALNRPMDFVFTNFEVGAVALAALIVTLISLDGKTNWLEGLQLLSVYVVIALAAFFL